MARPWFLPLALLACQPGTLAIVKIELRGGLANDAPDLTLYAPEYGDAFGGSTASAGDVNGDGYGDVLIGDVSGGELNTGAVHLYYGSEDGLQTSPLTLNASVFYFGYSITGAGDVNADGYDDVLVGELFGGINSGVAYLYYGAKNGLQTSPLSIESPIEGSLFGIEVASAGDVNGDGYDDILVGDLRDGSNGYVNLYYGSETGPQSSPPLTLNAPTDAENFGRSLASAGDVNNDGYDDVLAGDISTAENGRFHIYYGSKDGLQTTPLTLLSEDGGGYVGYSVAGAGDVNADGYDDVLVGVSFIENSPSVSLYYGSETGLQTTALPLNAPTDAKEFGISLSGAGDVNADGYDDVLVGDPSSGSNDIGTAYLYYGSKAGLQTSSLTLNAPVESLQFGASVTGAGDVDADGYDDILIGDYAGGSNNEGSAHLYYGVCTQQEDIELCDNGIDDNCDGAIDEGCPNEETDSGMDSGIEENDSGMDSGIEENDSGMDSGIEENDSGMDSGIEENDSGMDSGIEENDSGMDSGIEENDSGDAGTTPADESRCGGCQSAGTPGTFGVLAALFGLLRRRRAQSGFTRL